MIKIKNNRREGSMFHYAHFICDCLFPEIIADIFNYNESIREIDINQTIGNFSKIYTDVMMIKNTELLSNDFNNLNVNTIYYKNKEEYCDKIYFDKFRNFIFKRYNIKNLEYINYYPEVILIKRNDRVNLIDDKYLSKNLLNTFSDTNGKERREIKNVIDVEKFLKNKYKNKFKNYMNEKFTFI